MYTSTVFKQKTLGILLSLVLYGPTLYGQQTLPSNNNSQSMAQSDAKKRIEIQNQSQWAENEVKKSIIPDAVTVFEETKKAISFIDNEQINEAQAAIESATAKIDALLAQQPDTALLPIDYDIDVIDTAPKKLDMIRKIGKNAEIAVKDKDYPDGRLFLDSLQSEINVYTYSLPLAIYPAALKKAAYLLSQKKTLESATILENALDSLVVFKQTLPIPIIYSKVMLALAEEKEKENRNFALELLTLARYELERAKELGYMGTDEQEYSSLNDAIKQLDKQMSSNNTSQSSTLRALKDRIEAFLKRHFGKKKQSN